MTRRALRVAGALAAVVLIVGLASACGGQQTTVSRAHADDAIVHLAVDVDDATVWVNDHQVGLVADIRGGMSLSPGTHRLEIRHEDFYTRYMTVTLEAREKRTLSVELAPILP